jgi:uncharacterized protein (TIGR02453 family)
MNSKAILKFLKQLDQNNNKVWFDTHREEYQSLRLEWIAYAERCLEYLGDKNPDFWQQDPRKCIFRINRDVRFSHNKHPYKNNFGMFFVPGGKNTPNAGYYLHLEPGRCAIAGGIHSPDKVRLDEIRQRLLPGNTALPNIIKNKKFIQFFGDLERQNSLKVRPVGYDKDHPRIDLIKLKGFTVWKPISEAQIAEPDFFKTLCEHFDAMEDFINWINGKN